LGRPFRVVTFLAAASLIAIAVVAVAVAVTHRSHDAPHGTTKVGGGGAASREVMWTRCRDVVGLSDAQLDEWHRRGVGGFVCQIQYLAGLGGTQVFSADPHAALTGSSYDLQRQIRDSGIVARAAARGIKIWVGFYLGNYYNKATPLEEWFNDSAWSTQFLPQLGNLAGAAHMLGFAGLAFDEELYSGATWSWDSPTNTHSEAEVRAKVTARGAQMMSTIVAAFPDVDVIDYGTYFPDSWNALVEQQVNHLNGGSGVQINFWEGLTSVAGYGPIRFMDATFYKATQLSGATWDTAAMYNINGSMAYLSRNLTNWDYASSRIDISPFAWIDGDVQNEGSFTAPRPPAYVATQLAAFRRWGMGGAFAIYSYAPLGTFDYTPYIPAMQAAAVPGTVDDTPPGITITATRRTGSTIIMTGTATDNMAIRDVRWQTPTTNGAAPMTWTVTNGSWRTGYQWHMDWTATIPAPTGTTITITAQDTSDNTAALTRTAP
jgi:hypothetical protein